MDKKHNLILRQRRIEMLDISPGDNVLDYLLSKTILTEGEYEEINQNRTPKKQAQALLGVVPRKGKRAFAALIESLQSSESDAHHDLAAILLDDAAKAGVPVGQSATDGQAAAPNPPVLHTMASEPETAQPGSSWNVIQAPSNVSKIVATGTDEEDFELVYPMTHSNHGLALIINNRNFTCGMKDRMGSDVDAKNLGTVFGKLGFTTHTLTNLTGQQIRDNLYSLAKHDHRNYDAVIITILSHGLEGKIYGTDGDLVEVSQITSYYKGDIATTLVTKPKIFILQACRGGTFDTGIESTDGPGEASADDDSSLTDVELFQKFLDSVPANPEDLADETDGHLGTLPVEADMILAYATVPGYVSWRNSERGSWFIQALVKVLNERGKTEHFMDMLTMVNNIVATEFQSKNRQKQMPAPVSHLRKKLFFSGN